MSNHQASNDPEDSNSNNFRPPTPEDIAEQAIANGVQCFRTKTGEYYASFPSSTSNAYVENWPLKSDKTQERLYQMARKIYGTNFKIKRSDLKAAAHDLELCALLSPVQDLRNRFATDGDTLLIDLADEEYRMIEVSSLDWCIRHQTRPVFLRKAHMQPLKLPTSGGHINELNRFIFTNNDDEWMLLVAWLLSALNPRVPSPILLVVGPPGSGKTTLCRRIRNLLDRSSVPVLGDHDMRQTVQVLQNHAIPCFENVSDFSRNTADLLCRAVTGNGIEPRKLFTDGESVLFSFQCPIIINGLALPSTRPDFLDRCIIIQSTRLEKFLPIAEQEQQFEAACPAIFGAIFDLLVKTLDALPSTPPALEFRMADFAQFGRAVATTLGFTFERFDVAYRNNRQLLNAEIVEDQMMARLIQELASSYTSDDPWIGTTSELSSALLGMAKLKDIPFAASSLPQSLSRLSAALGALIEPLKAFGVLVTPLQRKSHRKPWSISEMPRENAILPNTASMKEGEL